MRHPPTPSFMLKRRMPEYFSILRAKLHKTATYSTIDCTPRLPACHFKLSDTLHLTAVLKSLSFGLLTYSPKLLEDLSMSEADTIYPPVVHIKYDSFFSRTTGFHLPFLISVTLSTRLQCPAPYRLHTSFCIPRHFNLWNFFVKVILYYRLQGRSSSHAIPDYSH